MLPEEANEEATFLKLIRNVGTAKLFHDMIDLISHFYHILPTWHVDARAYESGALKPDCPTAYQEQSMMQNDSRHGKQN